MIGLPKAIPLEPVSRDPTRWNAGEALVTLIGMVLLLGIILGALAGCVSVSPGATPQVAAQQQVYGIESQFAASLSATMVYETLPPCPQPTGVTCAKPATVSQLTAAANVARSSLSASEATVKTSTDPAALQAAVLTAQSALIAYQSAVTAATIGSVR